MTRRRALARIAGAVVAASAGVAFAQPNRAGRVVRVALLDDAPEATRARFWDLFRKRLAALGRVEGRDLVLDYRTARGDLARLPALAAETVASRPDVIVAVTTTVALAARNATSTIPIVAIGPADPVKSGLVASLSRPGGNLTGVSPNQAEIAGKWLDLLREIAPKAGSVAYLTDTGNPGEMVVWRDVEDGARRLGLAAQVHDGVTEANVARALAALDASRTQALIVATTASLVPHRAQIVDGAARLRIPAIYARREYADAGGLVSYGADGDAIVARAAEYVQRILDGARPSDLPFEMASKYQLVLNVRTARAQGIAIPGAVRLRADEVIE